MNASETQWSEKEREIARKAFDRAYRLEIENLIREAKEKLNTITEAGDLWNLHDFLSAKRYDIDGKYDDRESSLIFVLAQLIQEGLLSKNELEGLTSEKQTKIAALSRFN